MEWYMSPTINGDSYCASTPYITVGSGGETDCLLIHNTSADSLFCNISHIDVGSNLSVLSEAKLFLRIYSGPTVTANGTAVTAVNMRVGSSKTSTVAVYRNPTISAKGSRFVMRTIMSRASSTGINQYILIEPGQKILITGEGSMSADWHFDVNFVETT